MCSQTSGLVSTGRQIVLRVGTLGSTLVPMRLIPFSLGVALVTLMGCKGEEEELGPVEVGMASVCLGVSAGAYPADGDEQFWQTTGTISTNLVGFTEFDLWSCPDDASHMVVIEDDNQRRWYLGWRMRDVLANDLANDLAVAEGAEVTLTFRARRGGGAGFTLTDARGVVAAVETTPSEQVLLSSDYPGFRLELGEHVATDRDGCGYQFGYELVLDAGADRVVLPPMANGSFLAEESSLKAWSLASYQYDLDQASCPEAYGDLTWAAFREL
jgi:hypothetical protein